MIFVNEKLTWRDVLDSTKITLPGSHISRMIQFIAKTDYKYFCWNGRIYDKNEEEVYREFPTEPLTIEDL